VAHGGGSPRSPRCAKILQISKVVITNGLQAVRDLLFRSELFQRERKQIPRFARNDNLRSCIRPRFGQIEN
jgi:hypothetical protein